VDIGIDISVRTVWDYKRADFQLMKQKITAENWEIFIQNERDMNIACTQFTKAFLDISELCIPKREVTIRSVGKIWFDYLVLDPCLKLHMKLTNY
jgi:hypothetical protein